MSVSSNLNTAPPQVSVSYPYLGSHLHTDNQTIIIWFVLENGWGVVVNRTGAQILDPLTGQPLVPAQYYTPNTSIFNVGYSEPNVVTRYNIIPYIGSVTLTTNTTPI